VAGALLDVSSTLACAHGGRAVPIQLVPRVRLSGNAVAAVAGPFPVIGCGLQPPAGPCTTARAEAAESVRVRAGGLPVLTDGLVLRCEPTGTPVTVVQAQQRVRTSG
jgi:hypothetical protein